MIPAVLPASAATIRHEAEDAVISQGVVATNHPGFSGSGFVDYANVAGSSVELSVSVPSAGPVTLTFRYANGSTANRPMDITVGGVPVAGGLAFNPTGSWDTWATVSMTANLAAGTNAVRAAATTASGGPNLDYLEVTDSAAGQPLQAENATISQGVVATNHQGFTGTGFVDYANLVGGYVEFTVDSPQARTATLGFRFANGSTANRPMDLTINGSLVADAVAFNPTTNWDTWATVTITVNLAAGTSKVRATATTTSGGPNLDSLTVRTVPAPDWSVAVAGSTMSRFTPGTLGSWSYTRGLYLYGQYLVYQRTRDPRYLQYIKDWADRFVDASGNISVTFNNLDSMQSGNILLLLYKETGQVRYRTAAQKIRDRLDTYPRTTDGGFWHGTTREHQLWGDGAFMVVPFLARFGQIVGDTSYVDDEAARQLIVYGSHLQTQLGILKHAYDESRTQTWADPVTGLAPESWCRAVGWYGMAEIEALEALPATHPQRPALLSILRNLVAGYVQFQDPVTGRWFQVVDKGSRSDNWTETSCSSMYTFVISRAVERGYVDPSLKAAATKGYQGVLAKVSLGNDGLANITDICVGTNVGDYAFYIARTRATNDFHGLGAFLIMNEQLIRTG
jgi:rhamnogalacturonyl hydrolase YesR